MIRVRKSADRGHFDHGWLDTRHTFSFGGYHDRAHMGFRALRVINEDWVQPGQGFGTHPHENMEILTYVLEGGLAHRDSLGTGSVIRPGELQRMTAGTGITHSEMNASREHPVHLYQIWLFPDRPGYEPSYEQRAFPAAQRRNQLRLVAAPEGNHDALTIHQDARVYLGSLDAGRSLAHPIQPGRHAWVQVLQGNIDLDGLALAEGDGLAVSEESELALHSTEDSQVLLFDLA